MGADIFTWGKVLPRRGAPGTPVGALLMGVIPPCHLCTLLISLAEAGAR